MLDAHNTFYDSGHAILGDFGAAATYQISPTTKFLEMIEVRAFGLFLDDVIALIADDTGSQLVSALRNLRGNCLASKLSERPDFSTITQTLQSISSE